MSFFRTKKEYKTVEMVLPCEDRPRGTPKRSEAKKEKKYWEVFRIFKIPKRLHLNRSLRHSSRLLIPFFRFDFINYLNIPFSFEFFVEKIF